MTAGPSALGGRELPRSCRPKTNAAEVYIPAMDRLARIALLALAVLFLLTIKRCYD